MAKNCYNSSHMSVQFDEDKQRDKVALLRAQEEEKLAETLATRHGVPYVDLSAHPINIDALRIIKEAEAREAELAVFNITDKRIDVAVLSPSSDKVSEVLEEFR